MTEELFIVEVADVCEPSLVGHTGGAYASPPQPAEQALALIRVLLGSPPVELRIGGGPWRCAIAGGRRTVRVLAAQPDGQLTL